MIKHKRFQSDPGLYPKITTLLHLSGGQDSTYVAWKWLKEHPNEALLIHHVNLLSGAENRLAQENRAVRKVLEFLRSEGLDNFVYHESDFNYGTLHVSIRDIQICTVFSAIILRMKAFSHIKKILLAWHKGEVNAPGINRGYRVKAMLKAFEIEGIELEFPIEQHTRKMMADEMPDKLLALCHTCRRPDRRGACGKCKTCLEMKKAGLFRG